MFKLDLHTHSIESPDGGISEKQYQHMLESNQLDYIAITDHNQIGFAQQTQRRPGDRIIIGEEIMTSEGEIIGLFLEQAVPSGLSPLETIKRIKDQQGLVYIPHPFETVRKGLHPSVMEELRDFIDIIEVFNGRAMFQNRSEQAAVWAKLNQITGAASSDAHGVSGLGNTFTRVSQAPTRQNIVQLLASGTPIAGRPPLKALLYPSYHRMRRKIKKQA